MRAIRTLGTVLAFAAACLMSGSPASAAATLGAPHQAKGGLERLADVSCVFEVCTSSEVCNPMFVGPIIIEVCYEVEVCQDYPVPCGKWIPA